MVVGKLIAGASSFLASLSLMSSAASAQPKVPSALLYVTVEPHSVMKIDGKRVDGQAVCKIAHGRRIFVRSGPDLTYSDFSVAMVELQKCPNLPVALIGEEARSNR